MGLELPIFEGGQIVKRATSISGRYPVAWQSRKLLLDEPTSLDQLLEQQLLKVILITIERYNHYGDA